MSLFITPQLIQNILQMIFYTYYTIHNTVHPILTTMIIALGEIQIQKDMQISSRQLVHVGWKADIEVIVVGQVYACIVSLDNERTFYSPKKKIEYISNSYNHLD